MFALALLSFANAAEHEVYAGTHIDVQSAEQHLGVGFTGQLGYRMHLGRFTAGAALAVGSLHDPVTGLELELGMHLRPKAKHFKPWVGVETVGLFADARDNVTSYRDLGPDDFRLSVRPLAFHFGPITLSTLEFSYGEARGDDGWRNAVGVNLFQFGVIR